MDNESGNEYKLTSNVYRTFFEAAFDAFFLLDLVPSGEDFLITEVNSSTLRIFGCTHKSQVIGKTVFDFSPEYQKDGELSRIKGFRLFENALQGKDQNFEWLHTQLDGTPIMVEVGLSHTLIDNRPVGVAVLRDITQRKKDEREKESLKSQLQMSQRIEAVGTLAGGIAHDFNNLLTIISGHAELAETQLPPDHPAMENLATMQTACQRAADLVRRILTFSRQAKTEPKSILIEPLVTESIKLMQATLPTSIEITAKLDAPRVSVFVDPVEIHQVVLNLCTNASHAIGEAHGRLSIALRETPPNEKALRGGVVLSVTDDGAGMSPETMSHVFEPYFTTKPMGKGTGLGLSVVHGIAESMGGSVGIESEPGRGTTVTFQVPRCPPEEDTAGPSRTQPSGGCEQILVIDDEPDLVAMLQKTLEKLGYQVLATDNAPEALELIREHVATLRLILTDLTMPQLTGLDIARSIQVSYPHLPVILSTGQLTSTLEKEATELGIKNILLKPMSLDEIGLAVREVLDGGVS